MFVLAKVFYSSVYSLLIIDCRLLCVDCLWPLASLQQHHQQCSPVSSIGDRSINQSKTKSVISQFNLANLLLCTVQGEKQQWKSIIIIIVVDNSDGRSSQCCCCTAPMCTRSAGPIKTITGDNWLLPLDWLFSNFFFNNSSISFFRRCRSANRLPPEEKKRKRKNKKGSKRQQT